LETGFDRVSDQYADGWDQYLDSLRDPPASLFTEYQQQLYAVSAMVLAVSEDKTPRGVRRFPDNAVGVVNRLG
jgi:glucoamylase